MIQSVYLGNARTLSPFPGVSAFYRALQRGISDREINPIFYVSSSPLNLYDLFEEFLQVGDLPVGPMLLREREIVPENLFGLGHRRHKLSKIRAILQHYPELPFILIGDSGQEDPEIYAQLAQNYRDRILGIYIRDVSVGDSWRQIQLRAIAKRVRQAGSQFQLVTTTEAAANHAIERGWIAAESVPEVAERVRQYSS
jgi:phosphatidate phosphatase APP1